MVLEATNAKAKNACELTVLAGGLGKGSSGDASESFLQYLCTGQLLHRVKTGFFGRGWNASLPTGRITGRMKNHCKLLLSPPAPLAHFDRCLFGASSLLVRS